MSVQYSDVPAGGIIGVPPAIPQGMLYRVDGQLDDGQRAFYHLQRPDWCEAVSRNLTRGSSRLIKPEPQSSLISSKVMNGNQRDLSWMLLDVFLW